MQKLYYELSVFSKTVHFKNLSAAALHVGLSQPQLSRIISKIEDELNVVLLDRTAKRKSGWTTLALQIAEIFEKSARRLESELNTISNDQTRSELHIGSLEGMADYAIRVTNTSFKKIGIKKVFIDIYDLSELEANFLSGSLDLIFTSKIPGRQKFKYLKEIGHQQLQKIDTSKETAVLSSFEYSKMHKDIVSNPQCLISNSLMIRKMWFSQYGGTGFLPSEVKKGKGKDLEPVYFIGSDLLSAHLFEECAAIFES